MGGVTKLSDHFESKGAPPLGKLEYGLYTQSFSEGPFLPHSHDSFEIVAILEGERNQHVAPVDIPAKAGSIIFMPPNVSHGATLRDLNTVVVLNFDFSFLHPELPVEASKTWSSLGTLDKAPELLPFATQQWLTFDNCSQHVAKLLKFGDELDVARRHSHIGTNIRARCFLSLWLLDLVHTFRYEIDEARRNFEPELPSSVMEKVHLYISAHLSEPIHLSNVADQLHISSSCLAARIKRVTGQTFGELLNNARLSRAKDLLVFSDRRVSEIAFETGFEDHAYFSRRFRQKFGMTPIEYRQNRGSRQAASQAGAKSAG